MAGWDVTPVYPVSGVLCETISPFDTTTSRTPPRACGSLYSSVHCEGCGSPRSPVTEINDAVEATFCAVRIASNAWLSAAIAPPAITAIMRPANTAIRNMSPSFRSPLRISIAKSDWRIPPCDGMNSPCRRTPRL